MPSDILDRKLKILDGKALLSLKIGCGQCVLEMISRIRLGIIMPTLIRVEIILDDALESLHGKVEKTDTNNSRVRIGNSHDMIHALDS